MAAMQPMPADMQAPEAGPPDMGASEDAGYTIELQVSPDGTFAVSLESAAQEGAEQPGPEAGEGNSRSFKDIKSALTAILEIVKNNGAMPKDGAEQADFMSGYGAKSGDGQGSGY